jgi:PAS domain S-box-containing protein
VKETDDQLSEVQQLRTRLQEAEQTLEAIVRGEVDALLVRRPGGTQLFTVMIEAMNEGAVKIRRDGVIVYCNRRFAEMLGTDGRDILGRRFESFVAAKDKQRFTALFKSGTRSRFVVELTLYHRSGQFIEAHISSSPLPWEKGMFFLVTDMTQRKRAEEERERLHDELDAKSRFLDSVLHQLPIGVMIAEASGRVVFRNSHVKRLLGSVHLRGRKGEKLSDLPVLRSLRTGEVVHGKEIHWPNGNGARRWLQSNAGPVRDRHGQIIAAVGTIFDITEQKSAQQRLRVEFAVTQILNEASTVQDACTRILRTMSEQFEAVRAEWWVPLPSGKQIVCAQAWQADPAALPAIRAATKNRLLSSSRSLSGRTLRQNKPIEVTDVTSRRDFVRSAAATQDGLRSAWAFPILVDRKSEGVMLFLSRNVQVLDDALRDLLTVIGSRIGEFIQRRRAEAASKNLPKRLLEAQEAERRRVARDLHDGVNQILSAAKFRLHTVRSAAQNADRKLAGRAAKVTSLLDKAIEELRHISRNLRPAELDDLGLLPALRSIAEDFNERTGIDFSLAPPKRLVELPPDIQLTLYRIFQEALTNIEKHAKATRVQCQLSCDNGEVKLTIRDNGKGFNPATARPTSQSGWGLENMRERASFAGGSLALKSLPGRGTQICVGIPLNQNNGSE